MNEPPGLVLLPPSQKGLLPFSHMLFSNVGIWIQSDPSTNSFTFSKTKQCHQRSSQYDWILTKNQQMFALLAICLSLCPHPKVVEESVNNQLHENYAEKMLHLQCSDEAMFDKLFFYVCPKFITPSPPNYGKPLINFNQVWSNCKLCANPTVVWNVSSQRLVSALELPVILCLCALSTVHTSLAQNVALRHMSLMHIFFLSS